MASFDFVQNETQNGLKSFIKFQGHFSEQLLSNNFINKINMDNINFNGLVFWFPMEQKEFEVIDLYIKPHILNIIIILKCSVKKWYHQDHRLSYHQQNSTVSQSPWHLTPRS